MVVAQAVGIICDQQGEDERGSSSVLHRKHLLEMAAASLHSPMPPVPVGQVRYRSILSSCSAADMLDLERAVVTIRF